MRETLSYDELVRCMRCGFCQPSCPTFRETGLEAASPRGRIALMKAVVDGLMNPDERFREQIDLCLGCRACEPVCPAGVRYGRLLEQTREALESAGTRRSASRFIRDLALLHLMPHPARLRLLGRLWNAYDRSGLRRAVKKAGIYRLFPLLLRGMEEALPNAAGGVVRLLGTGFLPAQGVRIGRVGLFRGCLMDVLFAGTNANTARLLSQCGYDVIVAEGQTCCGALHVHNGLTEAARRLARRNVEAFRAANVDFVVSNAGGCGAMLTEYGELLAGEGDVAQAAADFSRRVRDFADLVAASGRWPASGSVGDAPAASVRVTYQDSCHQRNVMRAHAACRQLLTSMHGVEYVELPDADLCCGSAGIYNLLHPEMAGRLLDRKMDDIGSTGADVVVASNPGCLLQIRAGIALRGLQNRIRAVHLADFLYDRLVKSPASSVPDPATDHEDRNSG